MSDKQRIVIIDDRLWKSIGRDVFSFATLLSMVGIGVLIDSNALQWVAGIIWVLATLSKGVNLEKKSNYTIAEARKRLDEIEASQ